MDAKDYLSGVYLDTKKFSKKEVIELMEDYFKYKTEYNEQVVKNCSIHDVIVSFDKGYELGYKGATSESCKQIEKNYRPNER